MDSWKEVVQPSRKPRSVGPSKLKPKKTTSKKNINHKKKKSRSVTIQIRKKPRNVNIQTPELKGLRSREDTPTPQCLVSVAGLRRIFYTSTAVPPCTSSLIRSY